MKKRLQKLPGYFKAALLCGGLFYLAAVLLGLFVLSHRPVPIELLPETEQKEEMAQLDTKSIDSRRVIVVDAGHGGFEPGAVDASGTITEAETTQMVADRVMALLALHQDEVLAVESRRRGEYATAMQRANTAVQQQADLMLSLHLNADESPYARGFSCFPTPPGRLYHPESYFFSQLLVEQVQKTGIPIMGDNGIYYHYYIPTGYGGYSKYVVESKYVTEDDPWEDESFGVVEYSGCPSVLVEQWFISNPSDMALFYSEDGMDTMAECIYLAICDYFGLSPRSL